MDFCQKIEPESDQVSGFNYHFPGDAGMCRNVLNDNVDNWLDSQSEHFHRLNDPVSS